MSNNYWQTAQTSDFNPRQNERKPRYWIYALIAAAVAVSVFVVIGIVLAVLIVAGMAPTPSTTLSLPPPPLFKTQAPLRQPPCLNSPDLRCRAWAISPEPQQIPVILSFRTRTNNASRPRREPRNNGAAR